MSGSDLESLTITNLRGYVQTFSLSFEKHKKLCIVYGENGTGKSTLCDALDLLGTDNIGSLNDRGLGQIQRYLAPIGKTGPGTIELRTSGATVYTATVNAGRVTRAKGALRPGVRVLRRAQLLNIVNAPASERYKAIADLVDVSGVEVSEQSLANLVKEMERAAAASVASVAGAKQIFEDLFSVAAAEGDAIAWARNEALVDPAVLLAAAEGLMALKAAYDSLKRRAQSYDVELDTAIRARDAVDAAAAELSALDGHTKGADAEMVGLLEAAAKLLAFHGEGKECPLCRSMEHADGLKLRIDGCLAAMSTLQAAVGRDAEAQRVLQAAQDALVKEQLGYDSEQSTFCEVNLQHASHASLLVSSPPVDIAQLREWLHEAESLFDDVATRHAELMTRAGNLKRLQTALSTYEEGYQSADRDAKLVEAAKAAHERIRSMRHDFVNDILEGISKEVGRLYEVLHPGEGVGKICIALHANKKASLDLKTSFQASDSVPPQAYLSDSHLDTLGVCVFLALAKMRDALGTILVLDDVLASVDEPHVDRLVELIYDQAQEFRHVLVTTHYRPWREKLRWGWLSRGQCQVVELGRWSADSGPSLVRSTVEIERLRKLLKDDDLDVQAVCAKAGVVLEAILDFLTELYQCSLPRKTRNEWTLGDLLPAIGKKLQKALRVECQDLDDPGRYTSYPLNPIIEELKRVAQTRNLLGAHFNKLSFELLDSDADFFAEKVLELADLLVHPQHGWPRNGKSGSYWAAAMDARRLHPLKEPE